jgi:hypothetical protein
MDFSEPRFWLDALQTVALGVLWLRKPGQDAVKSAEALAARMDVLDERMKHMAISDELTAHEGSVKAVQAQLEQMQEAMRMLSAAVVRIETFLREKH